MAADENDFEEGFGEQEQPLEEEIEPLDGPEPGEEPEQELSAEEASLFDEGGLAEAPEEPRQKKSKSKSDKTGRLYAAIERERIEKNNLAREYALLQQRLDEKERAFQVAAEAANFHLESSVDLRIKAAEKAFADAREMGDVEAEQRAISEMQEAKIAKSKSDDWRFQQQMQQEAQQQQPQFQEPMLPNPVEMYREGIEDFDESNRYWSDPQSPQFNPVVTQNMPTFVNNFNQDLLNQGLGHMIGSDEYRQVLQTRIDEALAMSAQQPQTRRQPQMRQVRSGGAPVRSGQGAPRTQNRNDYLDRNPQVAQMANQMLQGLRGAGYEAKPDAFRKHFERVRAEQRAKQGW